MALPLIADNAVVFQLPFRFDRFPCDGAADTAAHHAPCNIESRLGSIEIAALAALAGRACPAEGAAPIWQQPGAAGATERPRQTLSGDLYPVAARILENDTLEQGAGYRSFEIARAERRPATAGGGLAGPRAVDIFGQLRLYLQARGFDGAPPALTLDDAWVRLHGSGIGVLNLSLSLADGCGGKALTDEGFLRAIHSLSQAKEKGKTNLVRHAGYLHATVTEDVAGGDLLWRDVSNGRLAKVPAEMDVVTLALARNDKGRPTALFYRAIAVQRHSSPGETAHSKATLEQLVTLVAPPPRRPQSAGTLADDGAAKATADARKQGKGKKEEERIDHVLRADAGKSPGADNIGMPCQKSDPAAAYRLLHENPDGTLALFEVLPARSHLLDWLLALLPPMGKAIWPLGEQCPLESGPTGLAPESGTSKATAPAAPYSRMRLFTYTAVRLDLPEPCTITDGLSAPARELGFRLARHFDKRYQPTTAEIDAHVFSPFSTVHHSVATQGASLVVLNDGTEFLKSFLADAFARAYRPIGEICFHEYLYLLELVQESAILPSVPASEHDERHLNGLVESLARFRLFFRFAKISHMAHHNEVLHLWRENLGLNVIEADLARDVVEAERVIRQRIERLEAANENRKRRYWSWFSALAAATATFVTILSITDVAVELECPSEQIAMASGQLEPTDGQLGRRLDLAFQDQRLDGKPFAEAFAALCNNGFTRAKPLANSTTPKATDAPSAPPGIFDIRDDSGFTWREQIASTCTLTRQIRECALQAPQMRRGGLMIAGLAAAVAFLLAFKLMPRGD